MKFLEYTKKLYENVAYFDDLTRRSNMSNPFAKPISLITVVWIEEREKN